MDPQTGKAYRTPGKGLPRPSLTKARLRVIAYTGLAHGQLAALKKDDVDLEAATVAVTSRRKGRKLVRAQDKPLPQLLPLVPQAIEAFRAFDRLGCWGMFSNSSMWKAFQRACKTLGITGLRPYDFRHSWGSMIYAETRDLRTTGALLNHRSERTTRRYTIAAVAPHIADAVAKVRAKLEADAGARSGARRSEVVGISEQFQGARSGAMGAERGRGNRERLKNSA
jgi:integrase